LYGWIYHEELRGERDFDLSASIESVLGLHTESDRHVQLIDRLLVIWCSNLDLDKSTCCGEEKDALGDLFDWVQLSIGNEIGECATCACGLRILNSADFNV